MENRTVFVICCFQKTTASLDMIAAPCTIPSTVSLTLRRTITHEEI